MKRITLWLLSTLSVVVLLFGYDASGTTTVAGSPPAIVSGGSTGTAGSSSSSSGSSSGSTGSGTASGSAGSAGSSGSAESGSSSGAKNVTGTVASTQWGPVQVALTVSGGRITQVDVVQYPSGNPKDQEINDYALPILVQETTDQQSADIDMVSGATVTSVGYIQSLQSALDQANL
jgi:uncharacterized protein with FMN-binding domain